MTAAQHARRLKALYRDTAPRYQATIAPVMRVLVAHLLDRVRLRPGSRVLDIGAGTGVAACLTARRGCHVVGVDFSHPMLAIAHAARVPQTAFLCADAHALSLADAVFDVALAVFCFNETDPAAAFAEARRVLRPGGWLALLEWGPVDPLMALIDDVLADHATGDAHGFQAEMRALTAQARPWDAAASDRSDIEALLGGAGFARVACEPIAGRVPFPTPDAFIDYALAWSPRRVEVEAMPVSTRARLYQRLRARLQHTRPKAGEDGLVWQPRLLCAVATTKS